MTYSSAHKPIRVLICDDSTLIRHMFSKILSEAEGIEVIGTAIDPLDARQKIKGLNPDVLTLDIEMPNMDGLSFLEKIMTLRPMPVVMASTLTQKGADATIRALELGAVDYVSKPTGLQVASSIEAMGEELIAKVRIAARANVASLAKHAHQKTKVLYNPSHHQQRIIAIGSSTGGVEALRTIFEQLPKNSPPLLLVQHMPSQFLSSFVTRLDTHSEVHVNEAKQGDILKAGHAYVAASSKHLEVRRGAMGYQCNLREGAPITGHLPSVDALFHSVATTCGKDAIGVILTGMGKDGAEGMKAMHESGAYTIGQNQASCVVYGMPKAAHDLGGVATQLPLNDIAKHMLTAAAGALHGA